jgi:hypothetical protein
MRHFDAMSYLSQPPTAGSNPSGPDTRPSRTDSTGRLTMLMAAPSSIAATVRQGRGDPLVSLTAQRVRSLRPICVLIRIDIIGLIVIAANGIGHSLFHPVRDDSREAGQVVTSLAGGRATLDTVPENSRRYSAICPSRQTGLWWIRTVAARHRVGSAPILSTLRAKSTTSVTTCCGMPRELERASAPGPASTSTGGCTRTSSKPATR